MAARSIAPTVPETPPVIHEFGARGAEAERILNAMTPPRLIAGQLCARFGWRPQGARPAARHDTFPEPEGTEGTPGGACASRSLRRLAARQGIDRPASAAKVLPTQRFARDRFAMTTDEERLALDHVCERLTARFPDISEDVVRATVREAYDELDGPVRAFVPLLVERESRELLSRVQAEE